MSRSCRRRRGRQASTLPSARANAPIRSALGEFDASRLRVAAKAGIAAARGRPAVVVLCGAKRATATSAPAFASVGGVALLQVPRSRSSAGARCQDADEHGRSECAAAHMCRASRRGACELCLSCVRSAFGRMID
eukprot:812634-Prymnesium_polylepis.2